MQKNKNNWPNFVGCLWVFYWCTLAQFRLWRFCVTLIPFAARQIYRVRWVHHMEAVWTEVTCPVLEGCCRQHLPLIEWTNYQPEQSLHNPPNHHSLQVSIINTSRIAVWLLATMIFFPICRQILTFFSSIWTMMSGFYKTGELSQWVLPLLDWVVSAFSTLRQGVLRTPWLCYDINVWCQRLYSIDICRSTSAQIRSWASPFNQASARST